MGRKKIHQAARTANIRRLAHHVWVEGKDPQELTDWELRLPKDREAVKRLANQCWRCGVEGHKQIECPTVECHLCGESGHMKRHCPRTK
jgi:hypothetical protein